MTSEAAQQRGFRSIILNMCTPNFLSQYCRYVTGLWPPLGLHVNVSTFKLKLRYTYSLYLYLSGGEGGGWGGGVTRHSSSMKFMKRCHLHWYISLGRSMSPIFWNRFSKALELGYWRVLGFLYICIPFSPVWLFFKTNKIVFLNLQ